MDTTISQGYIKLHRSVLGNPRSKSPVWLSLWIHCLCRATYKEYSVIYGGKPITLQPGQFIASYDSLARDTGLSKDQVRHMIGIMKSDMQIATQHDNRCLLVTILNWREYQDGPTQIPTQIPDRSHSDPTQIPDKSHSSPTTQEGKERKEEEGGAGGEAAPTVAECPLFDEFWEAYPRHEAKKKARLKFQKIKPTRELLNTIKADINRRLASGEWKDPKFIPHPAVYLNNDRWEDEPLSMASKSQPTQLHPTPYRSFKGIPMGQASDKVEQPEELFV